MPRYREFVAGRLSDIAGFIAELTFTPRAEVAAWIDAHPIVVGLLEAIDGCADRDEAAATVFGAGDRLQKAAEQMRVAAEPDPDGLWARTGFLAGKIKNLHSEFWTHEREVEGPTP